MSTAINAEPRLHHVQCLAPEGLHRMAYWEWGDAANPKVLVCVHGLSRQGRDFDTFARAMCGEYRVVCPDVVGRGQSDWLKNPASYAIPVYVADMVTLAPVALQVLHLLGADLFWIALVASCSQLIFADRPERAVAEPTLVSSAQHP